MLDPTSFISEYGEKATLKSRILDTTNRDAETGWPPVTWTDSEINLLVGEASIRKVNMPGGFIDEIRLKVEAVASVNRRDRIILRGFTYEVELEPKPYVDKGIVIYRGLTLLKVTG